jgi:DNA-binding cell septation regulator SpoVG
MAFDYDVFVRPFNSTSKTVAFVQLTINKTISIDGFKIINGKDGLFVSAPNHKGKDKEGNDTWYDDVRFLGDKAEGQFRTPFQDEVYKAMIAKYNRVTNSSGRADAAAAQAAAQPAAGLW